MYSDAVIRVWRQLAPVLWSSMGVLVNRANAVGWAFRILYH